MGIWMIASGSVFAYTGCVLLFQSGQRRRRHKAVLIPEKTAALANRVGWALVLFALALLSFPRGFEIGLTIWLAALGLAGITSLLVSALAPKLHLLSPVGVAAVSITLGAFFSIYGGAG